MNRLVAIFSLILLNLPAAAAEDPGAAAWTKIQSDLQALKKTDDIDDAEKLFPVVRAETADFRTKYPTAPQLADATLIWVKMGRKLIEYKLPDAPTYADLDGTLDSLAAGNPSHDVLGKIRFEQVNILLQQVGDTDDVATWNDIETRLTAFERDFGPGFKVGGTAALAYLREQELGDLLSSSDTTLAAQVAKKLADGADPEAAKFGQQVMAYEKRVAQLKQKPMQLTYTAVDGRKVDLAQLRGKVVLLDFWATWCGPCVIEVPDVVATYQKYHDQGFEVVGVSLDSNKEMMLAFTKARGMAWPQFFDGKEWKNKIATDFHISSIPDMWLIDKKGMLVATAVGHDLGGQVAKLLAAP